MKAKERHQLHFFLQLCIKLRTTMGAKEAVDRSKVIRGMMYDGYGYSMSLGHVLNFLRDTAFEGFLEKGRWVQAEFDGEADDDGPYPIDDSATAQPLDGAENEEDMEHLLILAAEEAEKAEMTSSGPKKTAATAGAAHRPPAQPPQKKTPKRKVLGSLQPKSQLGFPSPREEMEKEGF